MDIPSSKNALRLDFSNRHFYSKGLKVDQK